MQDAAEYPLQQIAVMSDDHQCALALLQLCFQPLGGLQVDVVGGFIQQQHIALAAQHAGQGHPHPLPAGEGGHRLLQVPEAQGRQQSLCLIGHGGFLIPHTGRQVSACRLGNGILRPQLGRLGQIGHAQPAAAHYFPAVSLLKTRQQPQQRGLARAVPAHNADAVAVGYRQIHMSQQLLL